MRARTDLSLVAALLLTACAKPNEVELRLAPCGEPVRVDLDIQGYDEGGGALAPLTASFAITDSGVFGDDFATVGLVKPDGMVTADFTLTWHGSDDVLQVVVLTGVAVPAAGEVLTLGADDCTPVDEGMTTSDAPTGTSTGEPGSETEPGASTSAGTSSTGGETTTGVTTTTTTTTESTSDATTGTTDADTSTGEMTTGEMSMEDAPCVEPNGTFYCENGGPGQVGKLLVCMNGFWMFAQCQINDCMSVGFQQPKAVGCSGIEGNFSCVCQDGDGDPCVEAEEGCDPNDMMTITLCNEGILSKTVCAKCIDDDIEGPYCGSD